MPRPGPRPYECVRRAWHSERHQPMRGSIIQQIFRVVHETHNPQTKKNREWQEKLPVVVLKAEEIMYSKANSEAEYTNLDTLWDRVNDSINTIIRRDEGTETGELLPPCVEAALNLGCIPVRASRSQRHSNPRTYLNLRPQESPSMPPRIVDKSVDEQCPKPSSLHSGSSLNFARSSVNVNPTFPVSQLNCPVVGNNNPVALHSFPSFTVPPGRNKTMTMESNIPMKLGSVYPLYYGTHFGIEDSKLGSQVPENIKATPIFVGKPVGMSIPEPSEMGVLQNLFSCPGSDIASKRITQPDFRDAHKRPLATECDLSLRLGHIADPCMSMDRSCVCETEDAGSSSSQEENRFRNLSSQRNKEFSFFPGKTADDPFESSSTKWFPKDEFRNFEATTRKSKALINDNLDNVHFCLQPGLPSKSSVE
ncbi:uncharacterized protein LOC123194024 [Mangifera indica]|uniref:uncharacterized protein LOC123194024 n=1 Tax=Mangifera indica TaxID=29780 RepID=UPI001CFB5AF9|nr:uncharacterized protein LOC123194024 [Mangifera indica]XP_044463071.1 uncharacterized protein LOC123194024 [Mangifera indica]